MANRSKLFEPGREAASLPPPTILVLVILLTVIGSIKAIQSLRTDKTGSNALYFLGGAALVLVIDRLKEVERTPDGGWRIALQDAIQQEVKQAISSEVNPQIKAAANMASSALEIAGAGTTAAAAAPPQQSCPDPNTISLPPPTVADDPQKGRFGGKAQNRGRCLTASLEEAPANARYFRVNLEVSRVDPSTPPLEGWVIFYLHDTFFPSVQKVAVQGGVARLSLMSYGAFTVGAVADGGATLLELDLAQDTRFPESFRTS